MLHRCRRVVLWAPLTLLAACQTAPPRVMITRPAIDTRSTHFAGTPISGPLAVPDPTRITPADCWIVRLQWIALSKWPAALSPVPLSTRTTLLIADRSSAPLLGSPKLTADVQLAEARPTRVMGQALSDGGPADSLRLDEVSAALPPNVTAEFDASLPSADAATSDETFQLRISAATPAPGTPALLHNAMTIHQQTVETAFFDQTMTHAATSFALLQRLPAAAAGGLVLAALVDLRPATSSPADRTAIARCAADLRQSAQQLTSQATVFPLEISAPTGITTALNSLSDPAQRRASLTYLADQGNAPLCTDVALVADAATLADLSRRVQRNLDRPPAATAYSPAALGWALDHAAFNLLTTLADSAESGKLPPELAVVLTQYCGEAARHTASLDEIAHGVSGEADLHNRIVAQNLLFLTDPSPAARVRAFDWLNSRQLAPAGFDPLGTARQRRQAMDRATSQP